MSAIQFSGQTYHEATTTPSDLASASAFASWLEARFVAAGWTVQSGSGTTDVKVLSPAQPETLKRYLIRFYSDSGFFSWQLNDESERHTHTLTTTNRIRLTLPDTSNYRQYTFIGTGRQWFIQTRFLHGAIGSSGAGRGVGHSLFFSAPHVSASDLAGSGQFYSRAVLSGDYSSSESGTGNSYRSAQTAWGNRWNLLYDGEFTESQNSASAVEPMYWETDPRTSGSDYGLEALSWAKQYPRAMPAVIACNQQRIGQLWDMVYLVGNVRANNVDSAHWSFLGKTWKMIGGEMFGAGDQGDARRMAVMLATGAAA